MTFVLLAGMLCLPVSVFAAGPLGGAVATLSAGSASVDWLPLGSAERLVLTVSKPDGVVVRREWKAGETPSFSLFDAKGNRLADGSYTWELRAVPQIDKATRETLRSARAAGNDAAAVAELKKAGRLPEEKVQSGSFTIQGGAVLAGDAAEATPERPGAVTKGQQDPNPTRPADQVIPDDLIVQGSGCFGFDCVNNESFGFDTIRLKENNLRIKFEDTSVGSFPTNDWQLTANDSASGGQNKFSIEDITGAKVPFTVTAGAATNSIFVDSTGRIGLRTSTPVLDVHISTSNTPSIRLEQTAAGGFTAQTWDVAGNEANFFVRDVTGGSRLPFRIRPGAPTSSIDISSDGDVGIGTASPATKLHVLSSDSAATGTKVTIENTSATNTSRELLELKNLGVTAFILDDTSDASRWSISNSGSSFVVNNQGVAGVEMTLSNAGNLIISGTLTQNSDRDTKTDILTVDSGVILAKVNSLPIATWRKQGEEATHIGPMAQDFAAAFGLGEDERRIAPLDVASVSLAAVQALHQEASERDAEIAKLKEQNSALEKRLADLEALVNKARQ
jgi:hypothetical protein